MFDIDRARQVGVTEPPVGGEVGEDVTGVPRHHLGEEPAAEEDGAEARQAQHHEGEARVLAPPLAHQLPGGGRPPTVPGDDVNDVSGSHVLGHCFLEGNDWTSHRLPRSSDTGADRSNGGLSSTCPAISTGVAGVAGVTGAGLRSARQPSVH